MLPEGYLAGRGIFTFALEAAILLIGLMRIAGIVVAADFFGVIASELAGVDKRAAQRLHAFAQALAELRQLLAAIFAAGQDGNADPSGQEEEGRDAAEKRTWLFHENG